MLPQNPALRCFFGVPLPQSSHCRALFLPRILSSGSHAGRGLFFRAVLPQQVGGGGVAVTVTVAAHDERRRHGRGWGFGRSTDGPEPSSSPQTREWSDLGLDPQAVIHETAVRVRTLAVGPSETRCMSFLALYGMDEVRLFHASRNCAESPGFLSHLWHFHIFLSCFGLVSSAGGCYPPTRLHAHRLYRSGRVGCNSPALLFAGDKGGRTVTTPTESCGCGVSLADLEVKTP